jgi:acetoin utilization protein AcuB
MLVKSWMSTPVITVNVNDSMQDAVKLLKRHHIKILPIVEHSDLVGIITDRDLKKASASDATSLDIHEILYLIAKVKVKDIMTKNPITVPPYFTVEETSRVLLKNKISGVPVVDDDNRLVGIITQDDLFKVLTSITGLDKRGVEFAFLVEDHTKSIIKLADIIRKYHGRLISLYSTYEGAPPGFRHVYLRVYRIDRQKLSVLLDELKTKTTLLYMVDHQTGKRDMLQIYRLLKTN